MLLKLKILDLTTWVLADNKTKKILITGGAGFIGSHLCKTLINENHYIICLDNLLTGSINNISELMNHPNFEFVKHDIIEPYYRDGINEIYNLACPASPIQYKKNPIKTIKTCTAGVINMLGLAKKNNAKILQASTSEVYGNPLEDEIPIKEDNPIRPANPYSISKVGHDLMSQYYYKAHNLKIIITRMFSHEGARRGKEFALSSFANQIVRNEKGLGDFKIRHGNLDSVRTYNHIEDAIEAYWLCSLSDRFGEIYNIGGDTTCKVGDVLDMLINLSPIKDKLKKELDPKRVRPTDITLQIPSSDKFKEHFKWEPKKNLNDICIDLLEYWRKVI